MIGKRGSEALLGIALLVFGAALWPPVTAFKAEPRVPQNTECYKVYLVPFEADTSFPVTPERVTGMYNITSLLEGRCHQLLEIVRDSMEPGSFEPGATRMLFRSRGLTVYIDQSGGVRWNGREFRMKKSGFKSFKWKVYQLIPPTPMGYRAGQEDRS